MAKFTNKKEQVIDLKLTTYGRNLLAKGVFKPVFYAFYDDNVLYDGQYAARHESQNEIQDRIKNETSYIESITLFQDIESTVSDSANGLLETDKYSPILPRKDIYKFDASIGDAKMNGPAQVMPAWRIIALAGAMSSSFHKDEANETNIPQINVTAKYRKEIVDSSTIFSPQEVRNLIDSTNTFSDNKEIQLVSDDPIFYIEEVNTELLTNNFNIDVFEVLTGSSDDKVETQLNRKLFKKQIPQIKNDILLFNEPADVPNVDITKNDIEFYFDVLTDTAVDRALACRGVEHFSKESYYIEIDFDCNQSDSEDIFHDIYGSTMEPEICQ